MYRDREFLGTAIFVAWLKVTNNIDCGVKITRMTEPGKFGLDAYLSLTSFEHSLHKIWISIILIFSVMYTSKSLCLTIHILKRLCSKDVKFCAHTSLIKVLM